MNAVLTEIISLLTGGITGIATGVGQGMQDLVSNLFITTGAEGAQTLSTFGAVVVIFGGVGLAIGLCKFVTKFLTSWGARH